MSKLFEKTRKWKWFTLIAVVIAIAVVAGTISVIALAAGPDSQEEPPAPTPTVAPPPPPTGPAGQITLEDLAKIRPPRWVLEQDQETLPPEQIERQREIEIAGKTIHLPPDTYLSGLICFEGATSPGLENIRLILKGGSSIGIDINTGMVSGGNIAPGEEGIFDFLIEAFPEQAEAIKSPHTAVKPVENRRQNGVILLDEVVFNQTLEASLEVSDSSEKPAPTPTPTVAPPPPPHGPAGQITLEDLAKIRPSQTELEKLEKYGEKNEPRKEREIEIAGKKIKLPADAYASEMAGIFIEPVPGDFRTMSLNDRYKGSCVISMDGAEIWIEIDTGKVLSGRISPGKKGEDVFGFLIEAFPDQAEAIKTLSSEVKKDSLKVEYLPLPKSESSVEVSDSSEKPAPTRTPTVAPPPPPNGPAGQITLGDLAKIRPSKAELEKLEKYGDANEPRKEMEIEIAGKKIKLPPYVSATPRTSMSIEYPTGYSGYPITDDNRDAWLISSIWDRSYIWINGNTGKVLSGLVSPGKKGEDVFDFLIDAFPDQAEAIKSPHTAVKPIENRYNRDREGNIVADEVVIDPALISDQSTTIILTPERGEIITVDSKAVLVVPK